MVPVTMRVRAVPTSLVVVIVLSAVVGAILLVALGLGGTGRDPSPAALVVAAAVGVALLAVAPFVLRAEAATTPEALVLRNWRGRSQAVPLAAIDVVVRTPRRANRYQVRSADGEQLAWFVFADAAGLRRVLAAAGVDLVDAGRAMT